MSFLNKLFGGNKKHFACDGSCKGVSDKEGYCQMKECQQYGKPLKECNCESPKHTDKCCE